MGRADDLCLWVGEEDGLAVGGQDRKQDPRRRGDQRVGLGPDRERAGDREGRAEWTWWTVTSISGDTPIASATRARLIATISVWSEDPVPQFSPAKMPDDAPPLRVKKPWRASSASEVMISSVECIRRIRGAVGHRQR
jgi:hypothetical protein